MCSAELTGWMVTEDDTGFLATILISSRPQRTDGTAFRRTMLWSILDIATDLDFTPKNPMARVDMPVCKPIAKPVLTADDLAKLFSVISDPQDRLILLFAAFGGPRASEVFGIQWSCVQGDYVEIRNSAWHRQLREWRVKRKASFRRIYISSVVRKAFDEWRAVSTNTSPDALVFPSSKTGRPMWPSNWMRDNIQPIAKSLGLAVKPTFQILRRSCGTRNQKNGSLKDVQAHLGHLNRNHGKHLRDGDTGVSDCDGGARRDHRTRRDGAMKTPKFCTLMNPNCQTTAAKLLKTGGPGQSRTADQRFRKPLLYPSELQGLVDLNSPSVYSSRNRHIGCRKEQSRCFGRPAIKSTGLLDRLSNQKSSRSQEVS